MRTFLTFILRRNGIKTKNRIFPLKIPILQTVDGLRDEAFELTRERRVREVNPKSRRARLTHVQDMHREGKAYSQSEDLHYKVTVSLQNMSSTEIMSIYSIQSNVNSCCSLTIDEFPR